MHGHDILGETLLPGTLYASLAFEAAKPIAARNPVRLFEVRDVDVWCPVVVSSTKEGVETICTTHLLATKNPSFRGLFLILLLL